MPSTISAGTSAGTALNITSDTTGNLAFQTNNGVTALTIDTSQNVTFANNVTYSGTITATAGFSGNGAGLTSINASNVSSGTLATARLPTVPVANGGTGLATLTANNVLIGNGTGNVAFVAPGTNGNILTSNGTAWTSAAAAAGYVGPSAQVFTGNGTFTIPSGITKLKVTVVGGGGGGGGASTSDNLTGSGGAGGGTAIKYLTGLTPGGTLAVTIGGAGSGGSNGGSGTAGGNSTVASGTQSITTLTGSGGAGGVGDTPTGIAIGGTATNGDINAQGGNGFMGTFGIGGGGGDSFFAGTNCGPQSANPVFNGNPGHGPGGGGSGASSYPGQSGRTGGAGGAGVVVFEF